MSELSEYIYVYRQFAYSWGKATLNLRGSLLSLTIFGHHRIISEYYDIRCVTHQFARHLNTRWALHGFLGALTLIFVGAPAGVLLPESTSKYIIVPCVLGTIFVLLATIISIFFLRRTVRLRAYVGDSIRCIEFNYRPGLNQELDFIVARSVPHESKKRPPQSPSGVILARDWLAAFPLRFALNWIYLSYEYVKYGIYALIAILVVLALLAPNFSPPEYTPPQPLADNLGYFVITLPGVLVIAYMLRSMLRNDGPWLNRSLRRCVLYVARTRSPTAAVSMLEDALLTAPHDNESRLLLVQLYSAAGRFDDALESIQPLREYAPKLYPYWNAQVRFFQVLGEANNFSDKDL